MPKHWWASGGHFRDVNDYLLQKNNPFETPLILDLWFVTQEWLLEPFFFKIEV